MNIIGQLHLAVGCLAVGTGFVSMFVKKGALVHRYSGAIYTLTMILLCLSGFYMSWAGKLQFTFLLGAITFYLVITGYLAVKNIPTEVTIHLKIGLIYIVLFCAICFGAAILGSTFNWPYPESEPPYQAYSFLGGYGLFFLWGDIKYLKHPQLRKKLKLKRHISRICSSLLIAAVILFIGNSHVLPKFMRSTPLLLTPIITIVVVMLAYRFGYKKLLRKSFSMKR